MSLNGNQLARNSEAGAGSSSRNPISRDEAGDIASTPIQEEILRIIECPSCFEVPKPPIPQCTAGHIVCSSCRYKLAKCPICRSDFSVCRNFAVEEIVLSSKFNCNYKNFGCQELIVGKSLEEHGRQCPFRNGRTTSAVETAGGKSRQNGGLLSGSLPDANPSAKACFQWIPASANDQIPEDAVDGGFEHGKRFYIARAHHEGDIFLAKLYVQGRVCKVHIPDRQQVHTKDEYEVLVAIPQSVAWKKCSNGELPPNAIVGHKKGSLGSESDLFIGRSNWGYARDIQWLAPSASLLGAFVSYEVLVKTELEMALQK